MHTSLVMACMQTSWVLARREETHNGHHAAGPKRLPELPSVSDLKHPVPPTVLIPILTTLLQLTCDLYPGHTEFDSYATSMHLPSVAQLHALSAGQGVGGLPQAASVGCSVLIIRLGVCAICSFRLLVFSSRHGFVSILFVLLVSILGR